MKPLPYQTLISDLKFHRRTASSEIIIDNNYAINLFKKSLGMIFLTFRDHNIWSPTLWNIYIGLVHPRNFRLLYPVDNGWNSRFMYKLFHFMLGMGWWTSNLIDTLIHAQRFPWARKDWKCLQERITARNPDMLFDLIHLWTASSAIVNHPRNRWHPSRLAANSREKELLGPSVDETATATNTKTCSPCNEDPARGVR